MCPGMDWTELKRAQFLSDTRRFIRKHEITSTERILLYINMRILKLSIGNAVLQQRHMPYMAVIAGLIHTMQFIYQGMWLQF